MPIQTLLSEWDSALITLVIFMAIDFTTGLIAAALGKSKHSWTGRLSSKAGWYGLAKKFCTLLFIVVAVRIGFCGNVMLSIDENTSFMGVPYPDAIKKAIDSDNKQKSASPSCAVSSLNFPSSSIWKRRQR